MAEQNNNIQFIDLHSQRRPIQARIDEALKRVMEHGQYILGPEVSELESKLCEYTGAKHAISCASGTDALKLVLLAKSLKQDEVVFVPSFTFASTAEVVAELGAIPYFVDVDEDTYNIDPNSLNQAIKEAKANNLSLAGVIAVDLFGLPADYPSLQAITEQHNMWLLADAAQSFGGKIGDKKVGNLTDISATSFFPSKPLGGYGDGGCIFTEDDEINEKTRSLRVHGAGSHRYDHIMVGLNSRLDTFQAAILLEKLAIFDTELKRRHEIAKLYNEAFQNFAKVPNPSAPFGHAFGLYTISVAEDKRDELQNHLQSQNIPAPVYYKKPLHVQPAYKHYPSVNNALPVTDHLIHSVISLPMHPYLTDEQVEAITKAVTKVF